MDKWVGKRELFKDRQIYKIVHFLPSNTDIMFTHKITSVCFYLEDEYVITTAFRMFPFK